MSLCVTGMRGLSLPLPLIRSVFLFSFVCGAMSFLLCVYHSFELFFVCLTKLFAPTQRSVDFPPCTATRLYRHDGCFMEDTGAEVCCLLSCPGSCRPWQSTMIGCVDKNYFQVYVDLLSSEISGDCVDLNFEL